MKVLLALALLFATGFAVTTRAVPTVVATDVVVARRWMHREHVPRWRSRRMLTRILLAASFLLPPAAWAGMFRRDPPRLMLLRPGCTAETVIEAGDPARVLYRIAPEKLPTCVVVDARDAATVTGRCGDGERVAAVVREFDATLCGGGNASR